MIFTTQCPELSQWLTFGGCLQVQSANNTQLEALLGDPGGFLPDTRCVAATLDELWVLVEAMAGVCRRETLKLQQALVEDLLVTIDSKEIRVTGWPPMPNPRFQLHK